MPSFSPPLSVEYIRDQTYTATNYVPARGPRRYYPPSLNDGRYMMSTTLSYLQDPIAAAAALSTGLFVYKVFHAAPNAKSRRNHKPQQFLDQNFVFSRANLRAGRWWTFITHTFNHASLDHLAVNTYGLWTYGHLLIPLIGPINTVILYIGSSISGALLTLRLEKSGFVEGRKYTMDQRYMGASESVLGLMTSYTMLFPNNMVSIWPGLWVPAWMKTIGFAAYSYWAHTNEYKKDVGHLGHLGGMLFGVAYYILARRIKLPWM